MAKGTEIILSAEPRGRMEEIIITDASYPGMLLEFVPGQALVSGRPKMRARSSAAGSKGPVCVLLPDRLQGKRGVGAAGTVVTSGTVSVAGPAAVGDPYTPNTQAPVYWPMNGDELNLLVADVAGTADVINEGDNYGIGAAGKLVKDSSFASAPFVALETTPALTGDAMIAFKYQASN